MKFIRYLAAPLLLAATVLISQWPATTYSLNPTASSPQPAQTSLQATKEHVRTIEAIMDNLAYHYKQLPINDRFSSAILEQYLKDLDRQRLYFTAKDIEAFKKYQLTLDNALLDGDPAPAFEIFNRYQSKVIARLEKIVHSLEDGIEEYRLDTDDTITLDRSEMPWASSEKELDQLWHKRITNNVLSLRLADKTPEEIQAQLLSRYSNQLNRTLQTHDEDVFTVFMNAVTQLYDPHTQYMSPQQSENFKINMSLKLEGIGAVLQAEDEYTKVIRLIPAGPADKAGELKPADKIIGVAQGDGPMVDVVGWRLDDVVELIRGPKGSQVRLEIIPASSGEDDIREISIIRDEVKLEEQAAKSEIIDIPAGDRTYRFGVIDIPQFYIDFQAMHEGKPDYRSTTRDVYKLLMGMKDEHIDGLVIDLRNNGGGSLQEANSLVGLFISVGPTVQIREASGRIQSMIDYDPSIVYSGPLVVLVNRLSASASEIFSGAIQDYKRGLVIGTQTFGKGTVQELRPLIIDKGLGRDPSIHGQLKITQAKFYRISGESTQHRGIIPDITYPSLIDPEEIGESTLPNALEWDTIAPAHYRPLAVYGNLLKKLRENHAKRTANDPDFIYLNEQANWLETTRSRNTLSLNLEKRLKEREEINQKTLDIANKRRKAKGQPVFESTDDLEAALLEIQNQDFAPLEEDPELRETGNILVDYIGILNSSIAQNRVLR